MTTRVMIANEGPSVVQVRTRNGGQEVTGRNVLPGEFVEFYVHDAQDLVIVEQRAEEDSGL